MTTSAPGSPLQQGPLHDRHVALGAKLAEGDTALLSEEEATSLRAAAPGGPSATETGTQALDAILKQRGWFRDPALQKAVEPVLTRLAARYLMVEARGSRALDPVAHFHLSNGARVERIIMGADTGGKGVRSTPAPPRIGPLPSVLPATGGRPPGPSLGAA